MADHMVVFGGERDGQTVNEVWRFHFGKDEDPFSKLIFTQC